MKYSVLIVILIALFGCKHESENEKFEKVYVEIMGKKQTEILNQIVALSDTILMKNFNEDKLDSAYYKFLDEAEVTGCDFNMNVDEIYLHRFMDLFQEIELEQERKMFKDNGFGSFF